MSMRTRALACVAITLLLAGCPKKDEPADESLTLGEAAQAVEESSIDGQASSVASSTIDISTNFTLGKAAAQAAEEIRGFVTSQLPCAEVSLVDATLSVTYGAKPGSCTYHGHTFSGVHTMKVVRSDDAVEIDHTWADVSNGRVKVSGTAQVTWTRADLTRHVKHELTWTRLSDKRTGTGTGARVQKPLGGDWKTGVAVDGARSWKGERGQWDLAITGVEWRWIDPVPQAGSYTLGTPSGRALSLSFTRADADTITVSVTSGKRTFSFKVNSLGDAGEGSQT
jgi:hypothetical protein